MPYAVGVDLGGTKIELGIVDERGQILEHLRLKTHVEGGALVVATQMIEGIRTLQQTRDYPLLGVGIGVAGQIHPQTGQVVFAPNLKWHDVPLQQQMEQALQLPVRITNDVRAITYGEWLFGAGQGCDDFICMFVGTGIGSGVVSGGHLLTGCSNTLGEVGHMTIDINGSVCTCGNRGCLEAFAGGWGVAARAQEAIRADKAGAASRLLLKLADGKLERVTAKEVVEAYRQEDPLAQRLLNQVERALVAGCTNLVNIFNPCRLILGGGFIDGFPEMIDRISQEVHQKALKAATADLMVVKAKLGREVGVIGSAVVIFEFLKSRGKG